jgi:NADPH2:quinone reductase
MPLAIQMTEYGPPSVLKAVERPLPSLKPDEVLIEVIASAVNRSDINVRSGRHPILKPDPFPYIPGIETVGTVCATGSAVALPLGTRVITMMQKMGGVHAHRAGGYQTHVLAPATAVAALDPRQDPIAMASLGLAAVTAYEGLQRVAVKAGDRVLITGASGGVGMAGVGLAKAWGAWTIAVTSHPSKVEALRSYGADEVWDLSQGPWERVSTGPVDGVLEMVGGATFRECVQLLRPGGKLCVVGAISGGEATFSVWDLLYEAQATGWTSELLTGRELQHLVDRFGHLLSQGRLRVPPVTRYPLTDAARAHADMEHGAIAGRLLLIP